MEAELHTQDVSNSFTGIAVGVIDGFKLNMV